MVHDMHDHNSEFIDELKHVLTQGKQWYKSLCIVLGQGQNGCGSTWIEKWTWHAMTKLVCLLESHCWTIAVSSMFKIVCQPLLIPRMEHMEDENPQATGLLKQGFWSWASHWKHGLYQCQSLLCRFCSILPHYCIVANATWRTHQQSLTQ